MDIAAIAKSRTFRTVILTLAGAIFVLCVFQLGVFVGFRKATFSYRWTQNYHENFAGPREGFLGDAHTPGPDMPPSPGFMDAHGMFGQVLRVDGDTVIIRDKMGDVERTILVKGDTVINKRSQKIPLSELLLNDNVVVIGSPDDHGQIDARLIRVFPPNL